MASNGLGGLSGLPGFITNVWYNILLRFINVIILIIIIIKIGIILYEYCLLAVNYIPISFKLINFKVNRYHIR